MVGSAGVAGKTRPSPYPGGNAEQPLGLEQEGSSARLSGAPSGQVPDSGRGSTKQPLPPHNKIRQRSP